jgi:hypothetical protein
VVTRERWLAWSAALPAAVLIGAAIGLTVHSFVTGNGWFHGAAPPPSAAALVEAVVQPDLAAVDALLLAGQSPNVRVPYRDRRVTRGETIAVSPLFVAVARGDEDIAALLIRTADLTRAENREAFCAAAHQGRRDMAYLLLANGADPGGLSCAMYGGLPPPDLAEVRRHGALAAHLRAWLDDHAAAGAVPTLSTVTDVNR